MLNVQDELLGVDFGAAEWGDWAASAEEWLNHAAEDLARLKQQLEELKEEYNRRTLAKRG
jgi:hypothetical protein